MWHEFFMRLELLIFLLLELRSALDHHMDSRMMMEYLEFVDALFHQKEFLRLPCFSSRFRFKSFPLELFISCFLCM